MMNKRSPTNDNSESPNNKKIKYNSSSGISSLSDDYVNDSKQFTLSFLQFEEWNQDQTASVLCAPKNQGGADLSLVEKLKPLCDAGFDGSVLGNIVENIKMEGVKYAIDLLERTYNKSGVPELSNTCQTVVFWVNNQLMPKLYHLWSADQVKEQLCKPIGEGGAGLHEDQVKPFRHYGFSGNQVVQVYRKVITIEQLLKNFKESGITMSSQLETTCESVVRWIMKTLYTIDQLTVTRQTFKKVPHNNPTFTKFESLVEIAKHYNFENSFEVGKNFFDSEIKNFQNRSQFIAEADQFITKHLDTFKSNLNGSVLQQTFAFGNLFNGSGCGKTRALREFKNILLKKHENTAFTYMSFFNGDQLTTTEKDIMSKVSTILGADLVIGFRLFCSFVPIPNNEREGLIYSNKNLFKFENVIEWISFELGCNIKKPLYLILAFDEYQKVETEHRIKMLHVVGTVGCNSKGVNEFSKKYGICLIPIVAGTISERDADKEFEVTGYGKVPFYLSPLQTSHCEQVFLEICSSKNLITSDDKIICPQYLWKQQDFSILYSQIAIIPKHAILFHTLLLNYCAKFTYEKWNEFFIENRLVEIKNQVNEYANSFLQNIPDDSREFYDLVLSANHIPSNSKFGDMVNGYLNRGLIYLSKNHSIYCNYYQFFSLLSKYGNRLNNTLHNFSYLSVTEDDFEIIGIYTIMSRMSDLLNRGCKFVSISTIFPGINIGVTVNLQLPKSAYLSEFQTETDYYLTSKTEKTSKKKKRKSEKDRVSDSEEYITSPINLYLKDVMKEPSHIYKSKINQKLVDGRWFTYNEEGKKILILMQWKLRKKGCLKIDNLFEELF